MSKLEQALLSAFLGAALGYLLGTWRRPAVVQDTIAAMGGVCLGVAILVVRAGVFLANATREHGIAAVGVDPSGSALVAFKCLGVVAAMSVIIHVLFLRFVPTNEALQAIRPASIGALAGATTGWFLGSTDWWAE